MKDKDKYKDLIKGGQLDLAIALMIGQGLTPTWICYFIMKHYEIRKCINDVSYNNTFQLELLGKGYRMGYDRIFIGRRIKKCYQILEIDYENHGLKYTEAKRYFNKKRFRSEANGFVKSWIINHIKDNYG